MAFFRWKEKKSALTISIRHIGHTQRTHTHIAELAMLLRLRRNASKEKNAEGIKKRQPKAKRKTKKVRGITNEVRMWEREIPFRIFERF